MMMKMIKPRFLSVLFFNQAGSFFTEYNHHGNRSYKATFRGSEENLSSVQQSDYWRET